MTYKNIVVIANEDKALLPTMTRAVKWKSWHMVEPVMTVPLTARDLCQAIVTLYAQETEEKELDEIKRYGDVILRATKSKSIRSMTCAWVTYSFDWKDGTLSLHMSYRDSQGRWQYDPKKSQKFDSGTPLEVPVSQLIDDVHNQLKVLRSDRDK